MQYKHNPCLNEFTTFSIININYLVLIRKLKPFCNKPRIGDARKCSESTFEVLYYVAHMLIRLCGVMNKLVLKTPQMMVYEK